MAEFFAQYGLFLAKAVTVVVSILVIVGGVVALSLRGQAAGGGKERLEVKNLNQRYDDMALSLRAAILPKKTFKKLRRSQKKEAKQRDAASNADVGAGRPRLFVLRFDGDLRASAVTSLREEISALLSVADEGDEVLVRLESPGGLVNAYGLAASQLARIRSGGLKLIVAVDKVAASGGYMMACVADRIIAAPFAVVGSIGVVAQVPNVHRLLKKNAVDFELFTAGEYKRTVTIFGENTDRDRRKFQQDLDETHELFKDFIRQYRPQLAVERVATGEIWYGAQAIDKQLIDEIRTSDDYLMAARERADLYELRYHAKKSWLAKLTGGAQESLLRRWATSSLPLGPRQRLPDQHLL